MHKNTDQGVSTRDTIRIKLIPNWERIESS